MQSDFSKEFPFLKIEIANPISAKEVQASMYYAADRLISKCRLVHNEGTFIADNTLSVMVFEQQLLEEYGLAVEVFRKCGNSWIATILSRSWSLERQNNEGFETTSFDHPLV